MASVLQPLSTTHCSLMLSTDSELGCSSLVLRWIAVPFAGLVGKLADASGSDESEGFLLRIALLLTISSFRLSVLRIAFDDPCPPPCFVDFGTAET